MKQPKYDRIIYVELKNGRTGYYERYAYVDTNNGKLKVNTGYRTMFPEMDDYDFISFKDIKYWIYVYASFEDVADCKGRKNVSQDECKKLHDDYMAFKHNYWQSHIESLQDTCKLDKDDPVTKCWNAWLERDPIKACDFLDNWIDGLWWSDGEIEDPSHSLCLVWKAGFKEAVRLIHEGKMEVKKEE